MIVEFKAFRPRKVRGTDVVEGQTLYAVWKHGLLFIWAYADREMAEYIDGRAKPESENDIAANWRRNLRDLVATGRTFESLQKKKLV